MPDHATSTSPAVQYQLDRLTALSPGADILGLERITALLDRLGNPHRRLPPVFHVAGTNGKGSTCAFLRTALEAAGFTVHAYTSPHLVRFNERIRLAGQLIDDEALAALLTHVLDHAEGIGASFFEVTTAAAFHVFAQTPADACVIEVGLGGRLDATNVIPRPLVTGIAQLGIDHQAFLGDTAEAIAAEKAGIAKLGAPLVTMRYPPAVDAVVARAAASNHVTRLVEGEHWLWSADSGMLAYRDAHGTLVAPLPSLAGPHQPANLALATAMLRHQQAFAIPPDALVDAALDTRWPGRMQRLRPGPLVGRLPPGSELWLDGGHNPAAAAAVSAGIAERADARPIHLILGMLSNKDAHGLLAPFAPLIASLHAVPVPGHEHHAPDQLVSIARDLGIDAMPAAGPTTALDDIAALKGPPSIVLILGSLYLAGTILQDNLEVPD